MSTTLNERSGSPGTIENDQWPEPAGFLLSYPGYQSTALLDRLRATEYSYLDAGGHVYLDYTGAGLPAQAQLNAHAERMHGRCFGNPHSENPTSAASTELIERARLAVLAHFNAPPDEYAAIFTPNATGAERRGDAPARWSSTWTFSACRAAGRSAHPWAWHRTSTTRSDSSHS